MIQAVSRLIMLGLLGWFIGVPIAMGVMADKNRQKCWSANYAGDLRCKGDGTYSGR